MTTITRLTTSSLTNVGFFFHSLPLTIFSISSVFSNDFHSNPKSFPGASWNRSIFPWMIPQLWNRAAVWNRKKRESIQSPSLSRIISETAHGLYRIHQFSYSDWNVGRRWIDGQRRRRRGENDKKTGRKLERKRRRWKQNEDKKNKVGKRARGCCAPRKVAEPTVWPGGASKLSSTWRWSRVSRRRHRLASGRMFLESAPVAAVVVVVVVVVIVVVSMAVFQWWSLRLRLRTCNSPFADFLLVPSIPTPIPLPSGCLFITDSYLPIHLVNRVSFSSYFACEFEGSFPMKKYCSLRHSSFIRKWRKELSTKLIDEMKYLLSVKKLETRENKFGEKKGRTWLEPGRCSANWGEGELSVS